MLGILRRPRWARTTSIMVTCDTGSCSGTGSVSYQVIISGGQSVGEEIGLPSAKEPEPSCCSIQQCSCCALVTSAGLDPPYLVLCMDGASYFTGLFFLDGRSFVRTTFV